MMTIHEVSKLAGVSVRTLHYYDAIGLLPPTALTESGYRLYDDTALARLQSILLFRELEFPLKDIKRILDGPKFDQATALTDQIKLLELQQARLGRLITLARETFALLRSICIFPSSSAISYLAAFNYTTQNGCSISFCELIISKFLLEIFV